MVEGAGRGGPVARHRAPGSLADQTCRAVPTLTCRPGGECAVLCPTRRPSHAKWFTFRGPKPQKSPEDGPGPHRSARTYRAGGDHEGSPDAFVPLVGTGAGRSALRGARAQRGAHLGPGDGEPRLDGDRVVVGGVDHVEALGGARGAQLD